MGNTDIQSDPRASIIHGIGVDNCLKNGLVFQWAIKMFHVVAQN
jgi:hypothetical protein